MKSKIKPIKQKNPNDCSIACLRMILEYYGQKCSTEEINDFLIKASDGGSYNTEIARFAKSKGFEVDCYAYNLYLTSPSDAKLSKGRLVYKLKAQMKSSWFDEHQTLVTKSIIKAIEEDVNYVIKKPTIGTITSYLDQGIPLIVSVNYHALHDSQGLTYIGHDVVIIGREKSKIVFLDPEHAKKERVSQEDLLFSIISRRAISTSAYLIAIKRK